MGWNPLHSGVLDPQLLPERGEFVPQAVDLGTEAGPAAALVRTPHQHSGEGVMAEGQDLEDGGLGPAVQARGSGILRDIGVSESVSCGEFPEILIH